MTIKTLSMLLAVMLAVVSVSNVSAESYDGVESFQIRLNQNSLAYQLNTQLIQYGDYDDAAEGEGFHSISSTEACLEANSGKPFGFSVEDCSSSKSKQMFKFDNSRVVSSQGYCLTATESVNSDLEQLGVKNEPCNDDEVIGFISVNTQVHFATCNGSSSQRWEFNLDNNQTYNLSTGGQCLDISGSNRRGGKTTIVGWFSCPGGGGQNYEQYDSIIDEFDVGLSSCSGSNSELRLNAEGAVIVEKNMPIIISL
jgi:hypothetical protein